MMMNRSAVGNQSGALPANSQSFNETFFNQSFQNPNGPFLNGNGNRQVSDRLASNPYHQDQGQSDQSLFAPDPPLFARPEVQYIEVERPVVTEKIVPKEIYEEVYVNIPTVKEVIVPVYVPVPQEEYVEVVEMLPPPLEDIPQEYRKIIAEGTVKLGLFLMENRRLREKLENLKATKEHEIMELRKRGIIYDRNKNRRYKMMREKRMRSELQEPVPTRRSHAETYVPRTNQPSYPTNQNWIERKITEFELVHEPVSIPDMPPSSLTNFNPTLVNIVPDLTDDLMYRAARSQSPPREPRDPNRPSLDQKVSSLTPWVKRIQRKEPYVEHPTAKSATPAAPSKATSRSVVTPPQRISNPVPAKAAVPISTQPVPQRSVSPIPRAASPAPAFKSSQPTYSKTSYAGGSSQQYSSSNIRTDTSPKPLQVHNNYHNMQSDTAPVKIQSTRKSQVIPGGKVVSDYYTTSSQQIHSPNTHQSTTSQTVRAPYVSTVSQHSAYTSTSQPTRVQPQPSYGYSQMPTSQPVSSGLSSELDRRMKVYNMDTNTNEGPVKIESSRSASPIGGRFTQFDKLHSPIQYAAERDTTAFQYKPIPGVSQVTARSQLATVSSGNAVHNTNNTAMSRLTAITEKSGDIYASQGAYSQNRQTVEATDFQVHVNKAGSGAKSSLRNSGLEEHGFEFFEVAPNFMDGSEDGRSLNEQSGLQNPPSFAAKSNLPDPRLIQSEISDAAFEDRQMSRSSISKSTKKSSLVKNKQSAFG